MKITYFRSTIFNLVIAVKGAGDVGSGIATFLSTFNFNRIYLMDLKNPFSIRRSVCFSEAVYKGYSTVEGVTSLLVNSLYDVEKIFTSGILPIISDPIGKSVKIIFPDILIDAIMAKRNTGTKIDDANLVIGLGPGFNAGYDVDVVIETKKGKDLGKIIYWGSAKKNSFIPGKIKKISFDRVVKSPFNGYFKTTSNIGDIVSKGDIIGNVNRKQVLAKTDGVLRGIIHSNSKVIKNMKIADIDPRRELALCDYVSTKSNFLGLAILETILNFYRI